MSPPQELVAATRAEEGCVKFAISVDANNEGTYFLYEEWASDEALAAHKAQPHFASHFSEGFSKYWTFVSMQKGKPLC